MNFIGIKTEQTEFTEKKWEKPFCEDLKNLQGISFGKMKIIVKKLDRFCDEVLDENHLLNIENEIHLDLIDETEDKFHEVGNVNIFLNNHLNENKLGLKAQEAIRQSLLGIFLGQEKDIQGIKDGLEEVDQRVDNLCRMARKRVLGRHGALHLEMEKYGAHTWNTRDRESKEKSLTEQCKEKLSTRNFLNQVIDIVEVEEDKKRSSGEDSQLFSEELGNETGASNQESQNSDLAGDTSQDNLKESPLIEYKENYQLSDLGDLEQLSGDTREDKKSFRFMKSGSALKQIISDDSKQTEKFKTTISGQKEAEIGERMTETKKVEDRIRPKIQPFGTSFENELQESDLDESDTEDAELASPSKPQIPHLRFSPNLGTSKGHWNEKSESMDLDSDEESLDNCTQEVMDFTNKGKKISMISLANKGNGGFGKPLQKQLGAKRISAIGCGFGSSMRMIQEQQNMARNYMTERPRGRGEAIEEIPLRKEIQQILGGSYAKMGSGSNSTLRYNQHVRASQPPRNHPRGDEKRVRQLLRVEKLELERILDRVEKIREEIKLVCVEGGILFERIEDGFAKLNGTVEKLFLRLCESTDKGVFDQFLLNELTVLPKKEVESILQNTSKNQNDKVLLSAELKAKKKRFELYEKKVREYEAKNHRLVYNNLQMKKQIESLSRKVTVLENKRQKDDEMNQRFGEVELKSLRLKLNQFEIREKQTKEEQVKIENKNFNLLRRKDNLMVNLKKDLRLATGEIMKLKDKLKEMAVLPRRKSSENQENSGEECSIDQNADPAGTVDCGEVKQMSNAEMLEAKDEEIHELKKRVREQANEIENLSMRITELKMEAEAEQNKYLDEIKQLDTKIEEIEQNNAELTRGNNFLTRRVDELRQDNEKLKAAGGGDQSYLFNEPLLNSLQNYSRSNSGKGEKFLADLSLSNEAAPQTMKGNMKQVHEKDQPPILQMVNDENEKLFDYMSESEILKLQQSDIYEKNSLLFNTGDRIPFEEINLEFEKKEATDTEQLRMKSKTMMFGGPTLVSKGSIFGEKLEEESNKFRFKKSKSVIERPSLEIGKFGQNNSKCSRRKSKNST